MTDLNLGIELGSTTIKLVLINDDQSVIATGSYAWQNALVDGLWTYSLDEAKQGIQQAYAAMAAQYQQAFGQPLTTIGAIGVSAMMHGYLAFDQNAKLLAPFRTWRNNTTAQAAAALSDAFAFNIPQRWSVAHYYQALLNAEPHVHQVAHLTTLAGYIHQQLSGEQVLGVGDASGMFPIDPATGDYRQDLLTIFDQLAADHGAATPLKQLLPKPLPAGADAGKLTEFGAQLLDPTGSLKLGAIMAPPEGDAGTGMVATNSVAPGFGNISVGTSAFSMVVLGDLALKPHQNVDIVATPDGASVAMIHANNCTADLNAWMKMLQQTVAAFGVDVSADEFYQTVLNAVADAAPDADGVVNFSNLAGENITNVDNGRPLLLRQPDSRFTLANFIQAQLYGAFAPLAIGMRALNDVPIKSLVAQGGLFRTEKIGQQVLADALNLPITVMKNAQSGGPFGMALLALYAKTYAARLSLSEFLAQIVFAEQAGQTLRPQPTGANGYQAFLTTYEQALPAVRTIGDLTK